MKILITSDTHGYAEGLKPILAKAGNIDIFIHAGDIEGQEDYIRHLVDCPLYMVAGNNDWATDLSRELMFMIEDYRVFLTHGHQYGISLGTERIEDEALSRNADIAIFGHTHRPMVEKKGNLILLNPGSVTYPRQRGRRPTYIIMTTNKDHEASFRIGQIDR